MLARFSVNDFSAEHGTNVCPGPELREEFKLRIKGFAVHIRATVEIS